MNFYDIVTGTCLGLGCFLAVSGGVGALRMPDFYTRLHTAGKGDSLAQILIFAGLIVQNGLSLVSVKLLLAMLFLLFTSPTATHVLAHAAHLSGLKPWQRGEPRR